MNAQELLEIEVTTDDLQSIHRLLHSPEVEHVRTLRMTNATIENVRDVLLTPALPHVENIYFSSKNFQSIQGYVIPEMKIPEKKNLYSLEFQANGGKYQDLEGQHLEPLAEFLGENRQALPSLQKIIFSGDYMLDETAGEMQSTVSYLKSLGIHVQGNGLQDPAHI